MTSTRQFLDRVIRFAERLGLALVLVLAPVTLDAQAARGVARGAARGAVRALPAPLARLLRKEAARDASTVARPLRSSRTVFRFTSAKRAGQEQQRGLAAGTHMTSRGGPGRPLSASTAQRRYGLPTTPQVRETIVLPRGTPIRFNRAWLGRRGVGEATSPKALPPSAVRRVVRLRR